MTYQEAMDKINSLLVFGSRPGLERIGAFMERIGSPQKKLSFVHIAGTNGKGSTCAMLANILKCAGYRTGLFISPYVLEFRERFQINGEMIPESRLCDIVERLYPVVEQMKTEGNIITEFEFVFAVAMTWYAEEQCDIVVLETGLGGRFDATNIIDTPLVSVITSISLDHTAVLGDTYEKIAFEKCGIIKQNGMTVAYGEQKDGVQEVIRRTAQERQNRLYIADTANVRVTESGLNGSVFVWEGRQWHIPLMGEHQVKNAVTVLDTVKALRERGIAIAEKAVEEGLAGVAFPARQELLCREPVVMLDGSHNPDGVRALAGALKACLPDRKKIGIIGMLADKDVNAALAEIVPLFEEIIAVPVHNPRAMGERELADRIAGYDIAVCAESDYERALQKAMARMNDQTALIIFGSLYLAGDIREKAKKMIISTLQEDKKVLKLV